MSKAMMLLIQGTQQAIEQGTVSNKLSNEERQKISQSLQTHLQEVREEEAIKNKGNGRNF